MVSEWTLRKSGPTINGFLGHPDLGVVRSTVSLGHMRSIRALLIGTNPFPFYN